MGVEDQSGSSVEKGSWVNDEKERREKWRELDGRESAVG